MQHWVGMSVFAFVCPKESSLAEKAFILMTDMLDDSWMTISHTAQG